MKFRENLFLGKNFAFLIRLYQFSNQCFVPSIMGQSRLGFLGMGTGQDYRKSGIS